MRWNLTLENADPRPMPGPTEINPLTGCPGCRIVFEKITLIGQIEGNVEYPTAPGQDMHANIVLENGIKIPLIIQSWERRRE